MHKCSLARWANYWVLLLGLAACGDDGGSAITDAPPGGGSADAAPIVGEPANLTGITAAHNQVRAMVQTATPLPALTWSPALAATAAGWVAQCKDMDGNGLVDHNAGRSTGHPYYVGENVFASSGTASGQQAVTSWASESANYTYATNACAAGKVCGHYTQIVWRDTHEIGCALADCPSLQFKSSIVCDYGPGGNIGSQKPY